VTWSPVTLDCLGDAEPFVTYLVPLWTGVIGFFASCPTNEDGSPQECAAWTFEERDVGQATSFTVPDPPLGGVTMFRDPIAVDQNGNRSDECAP
jgi:hypothetical protein